jgi:hypothetical protein
VGLALFDILCIWKAKVHTTPFGFQAMQVLTVTPPKTRAGTTVEAVRGRSARAIRSTRVDEQEGGGREVRQIIIVP